MWARKTYAPKAINFHLLPDLLEFVLRGLPDQMLKVGKEPLIAKKYFRMKTKTQELSTRLPDEFRDALRTVDQPLIAFNAEIDCWYKAEHLSTIEAEPPAFELQWREDIIVVTLARNTADNIKAIFGKIEEEFSLEPVRPTIEQAEKPGLPTRRAAFVAHSFDARGKGYAYEVVKLLGLLDFNVSTGEGFAPERVSTKVKKRLKSQEIVIVILSQKDDPTWLVQEASGAEFSEKPLFLLVEEGVEFNPGVLGDLEYIRFPQGQVSAAFVPVMEGLKELGYRLS